MEIELEKSLDAQVCGYVGRGVLSVRIDDAGHLIFTMSDGSQVDLGPVIGSGDGNGGTVELDTTLTRSGMAADAKATGDAITRVSDSAEYALQEAWSSGATALEAQGTATTAWQTAQSAAQMAQTARQTAQNAAAVADQAITVAGDLGQLETAHKTDLVGAINELHGRVASDSGDQSSGTGVWVDLMLARGVITAGTNLTMGLNTGLTLGHLRTYQKWLFRFKNAGKSTLTDFYLKVGPVANATNGTSILRNSTGGVSVFYEWWDIGRTKLAVQSVFTANPAMVDDAGTAVSSDSTSHWMYHNLITPSAIDKVANLSYYDDNTPVWICCTNAPSADYVWEFRGVTR